MSLILSQGSLSLTSPKGHLCFLPLQEPLSCVQHIDISALCYFLSNPHPLWQFLLFLVSTFPNCPSFRNISKACVHNISVSTLRAPNHSLNFTAVNGIICFLCWFFSCFVVMFGLFLTWFLVPEMQSLHWQPIQRTILTFHSEISFHLSQQCGFFLAHATNLFLFFSLPLPRSLSFSPGPFQSNYVEHFTA